jgi:monoamine oxidase
MADVVIVGGGVCGLALAARLQARGQDCLVFEARARLGGRVLTQASARSGLDVDLGPAWFWPESQPLITRLLADLALATFPQHEQGAVLHLQDPDKRPEILETGSVHGGAWRVAGGVGRLVEALASRLAPGTVRLQHVLTRLRDRGEAIELDFRAPEGALGLQARRVVLAAPPRLVDERILFEPPLAAEVVEAMHEARTWMASTAKVVFGYEAATWREKGWSGNAFVSHEQAVLGEIFDSCEDQGPGGALGGFLALSPTDRSAFAAGLPMLMGNQVGQVFGPELEQGEQLYQDWAKQYWTCSALDLVEPATEHVTVSNPLLRRGLWGGKLLLGGSETAAGAAGYLEGAISAAVRIDETLAQETVMASEQPSGGAEGLDGMDPVNAASLARFAAWVGEAGQTAFDLYRQLLNRRLAAQERDQLTQRAVLEAVEQTFEQALLVLGGLRFRMHAVPLERGRSGLMPQVQAPFGAFLRNLLDDVISFNRTSCALSNFPDEHKISAPYREVILLDVAAAWKEFCLAANSVLLAMADGEAQGSGAGPSGGRMD